MKKTLKILMALILFAVVLMLATSVNAATVEAILSTAPVYDNNTDFNADADADIKGLKDRNDVVTYTVINPLDKLTADVNNATINLDGKDVKDLVVNSNMKVFVKDTNAQPATITSITNSGDLTIDTPTVAATAKLTNNGGNAKSITAGGTFGKTTINAGTVEVKTAITPANLTLGNGYRSYTTKDANTLYSNETLSLEITFQEAGNDVEWADLEAGTTYGYTPKLMCGKVELNATSYTLKVSKGAAQGVTFTATQITMPDSVLSSGIEFSYVDATNAVIATDTFGSNVNPGDDNNGDNNQGDNNQGDNNQGDNNQGDNNQGDNNQGDNNEENKGDANQNEDKKDENNNDLDDTPKTGDHIIPATALLAVVVVANVVYFAKMKRN